MLSRYRLLKDDGTDLGLLVGGDLRSRPGDTLYRGATALEVVRIVEADPAERLSGYVVVAESLRRPHRSRCRNRRFTSTEHGDGEASAS